VINSLTVAKLICSAAVGYEWIDVDAASEKGIHVVDCPGNSKESVAEHTIALMLGAVRHIYKAITETKQGRFEPGAYKGMELKGKTLGVIGYGNIGKRVAEIAEKGFGMNILFTNSMSTREDLEKLLKESDFISIHIPANAKTKNLLSDAEFELMKMGVVLVNTADLGTVLNEKALIKALNEGKLYAAGLDTLAQVPYEQNHPLLNLSNVIVTPNMAWDTEETDYRLSKQVVEIVEAFVKKSTDI